MRMMGMCARNAAVAAAVVVLAGFAGATQASAGVAKTAPAKPVVSKLSATSAPLAGGVRVTVTGKYFTKVSKVEFGSTAGTGLKVLSGTILQVTAPKHTAGTVDVRVVASAGTSAAGAGAHFTYEAPPSVASVSPSAGPLAGGTAVNVTGNGFLKVTKVAFGGTAGAKLKIESASKLTVVAPRRAAGTVDVRVYGGYGTSSVVARDRYAYTAAPVVTGVSPATGPVAGGTTVTVTGSNLSSVSKVTFGGVAGTAPKAVSESRLSVRAPVHAAGTVAVQVTSPGGQSAAVAEAGYAYSVPGPVTVAQAGGVTTSSVTLTWVNPPDAGFAGVVIRRAEGTVPPESVSSGQAAVTTTGQVDSWADSGLTAGKTYSYGLFADDGPVFGYAKAATVTVVIPSRPSITGTITGGGKPVAGVTVSVTGSNGVGAASVTTGTNGAYSVAGLAAGSYTVCFNPVGGSTGASTTGFLAQCWKDAASGGTPTTVAVSNTGTVTGIDAALAPAGSISGTVTGSGGTLAAGVTVSIGDADGEPVSYAVTGSDGTWAAPWLPPGTYTVCFDPSTAAGGITYTAQCYDNESPDAVPTPVPVTASAAVTGINAVLQPASAASSSHSGHPAALHPSASPSGEISSTDLPSVPCADVLFLAARGSGESVPGGVRNDPDDADDGVGGPVYTAYTEFKQELTDGRTITPVISVAYPADNVTVILRHAVSNAYIRDLDAGVAEARQALAARATQCPNERIVLAGYSQGAMIMHRILENATVPGAGSLAASVRDRIDAVILIGDGDRVADDTINDYGTAKPSAQGIGTQSSDVSGTVTSKLPPALGAKAFSVCDAGDVVCDFRMPFGSVDDDNALAVDINGIWVHLGYTNSQPVIDASKAASSLEQTVPAVGGAPVAVGAEAGVPVFQQLTARYSATSIQSVSWSLPPNTALPAGLSLASDGMVSGTPGKAGAWAVDLSLVAVTVLGLTESPVSVVVQFTVSPAGSGVAVPAWTAQNLPVPGDASSPVLSAVNASCAAVASRTQCAAAGSYATASGTGTALWIFQQGKWSVTEAPVPDPGASADDWDCNGSCQSGSGPVSCGQSGMCAVVGGYLNAAGTQQEWAVWVWSGGTWQLTPVPVPANAADAPGAWVQSVGCGVGPYCALTMYYTDASGNQDLALGIWRNGQWQVSEAPLPGVSFYPNWDSSITCGVTCVATSDYFDGVNWWPDIWTWNGSDWTAGLPQPYDSSPDIETPVCAADECLEVAWGYIYDAWMESFWVWYAGEWHYVPVPLPSDATKTAADGDARIQSFSCGGALCAMTGSYENSAGNGVNAMWTIEGATAKVYEVSSSIAVNGRISCSATMCATSFGTVFDPVTGFWVGNTLPAPAGSDGTYPEAVACATDGCVVGGSYFEPGPGYDPSTSAAWTWVDDTWHEADLSPVNQGNQYSPDAATCGQDMCVMSVNYVTPGDSAAVQLWMSSAFEPEGT
jgi:hypothetical protein